MAPGRVTQNVSTAVSILGLQPKGYTSNMATAKTPATETTRSEPVPSMWESSAKSTPHFNAAFPPGVPNRPGTSDIARKSLEMARIGGEGEAAHALDGKTARMRAGAARQAFARRGAEPDGLLAGAG